MIYIPLSVLALLEVSTLRLQKMEGLTEEKIKELNVNVSRMQSQYLLS